MFAGIIRCLRGCSDSGCRLVMVLLCRNEFVMHRVCLREGGEAILKPKQWNVVA